MQIVIRLPSAIQIAISTLSSPPKTEAQPTTVDESRREKWIFNIIVRVALSPSSRYFLEVLLRLIYLRYQIKRHLPSKAAAAVASFPCTQTSSLLFFRSLRCLSRSKTYCTSLAISLFALPLIRDFDFSACIFVLFIYEEISFPSFAFLLLLHLI
jgi:hypothetical protein